MDTLFKLLRVFGDKYLLDDKYIRYGKLEKDLNSIKELEREMEEATQIVRLFNNRYCKEVLPDDFGSRVDKFIEQNNLKLDNYPAKIV